VQRWAQNRATEQGRGKAHDHERRGKRQPVEGPPRSSAAREPDRGDDHQRVKEAGDIVMGADTIGKKPQGDRKDQSIGCIVADRAHVPVREEKIPPQDIACHEQRSDRIGGRLVVAGCVRVYQRQQREHEKRTQAHH